MKLIKLDRRHNLYHYGYHWAFVGDRWSIDSKHIEIAVNRLEGFDWRRTFWSKAKVDRYTGRSVRNYYIGMKIESTATMALLKMK